MEKWLDFGNLNRYKEKEFIIFMFECSFLQDEDYNSRKRVEILY